MGSGARSNGSGEALPTPSCPLRPSKNKKCPPAGCGAEPCCFSPAWHHDREAIVMPCRFFPFPIPWTKSVGFFIRFAEVLVRCLCFHFSTYVVHAVSEDHCKLEIWAVTKIQTLSVVRVPRTTEREGKKAAMGALPPNPRENKKIKDSNPPCCPRSANNREGRKKGSYGGFAPKPP